MDRLMSWALMLDARHWPLDPTARLVAIVLASHANKSGRAWPSLATLQDETGLGRTAVIEALQRIERADLLAVLRRTGRASEYVFAIPVDKSYPHPSASRTDPSASRTDPSAWRTHKGNEREFEIGEPSNITDILAPARAKLRSDRGTRRA